MAGDHHGIYVSWRHYALSSAEEDPGLEFDITRQPSLCGTGHIARCSELHLAWSFIPREARPCVSYSALINAGARQHLLTLDI